MLGVLVCAPPGFGKTALLSTWAHEVGQQGDCVAWLNVDESDDDPTALCSAMLTAVRHAIAPPTCRPIPQPRGGENNVLARLVNVVDQQRRLVWLILDDFHRLHHPDALRALETLLRQSPRRLRLVIGTRQYPATGLHRLRVAGLDREIRASDLAFTAEEATELMAAQSVQLGSEELAKLMTVTEGWPVAVRLAAVALAESTDRTATLDGLAVMDRTITEYLAREVVCGMREEQQRLLRCTSVTDRFSVELATELTQHPEAPTVLGEMDRSNLLVFRCADGSADDEGEYRQHPLLRAHVYMHLKNHAPAQLAHLHRLASGWYARNGRPVDAARHAVKADDTDHVARLLVNHGLGLLLRGEHALASRLAALLPATTKSRADVGLILTLTELMTGERSAAELRLTGLAAELAANRDPHVRDLELIVRTQWARIAGRFLPYVDELDQRIAQMSDPDLLLFALMNRGGQLFWLGKHEEASRDLEHALSLATRHKCDPVTLQCMSFLAGIASMKGDLPEMRRMAQDAIAFAGGQAAAPHTASCLAFTTAADACYQSLALDQAAELIARAVDLIDASVDRNIELYALTLREAIEFETGTDPIGALIRLRAVWTGLSRTEPVHPSLVMYSTSVEQRMALRLARADWAAEAERRAALWLGESADVQLLRARVHAHHGRVTAARNLLDRIIHGHAPKCSVVTVIEAHILAAILAARANERQAAAVAVRTAIELTAPGEAVQPFYHAGQDIRQLLVAQAGRMGRLNHFVEKLLRAIPASSTDRTIELTPREAQLLLELPSLATLEEIAVSCYVSVNTVKTHLRNLYRKLGVTSRREAVDVGRERGLI